MILPMELSAPSSVDGCDAAAGADAARGAAAGAAAGAAPFAPVTSSAMISPPGPVPLRFVMSTLSSFARRRAFGEILMLPAAAATSGSGAAAAAAGAAAAGCCIEPAPVRPVATDAPAAGGCSPGFSSHAIVCPTGTTAPTCAVMPPRIPSTAASISTTALSVSTSRSSSPFLTASPSFFFQETSFPVSCAISSAGITTLVAIG